MIENKTKAETLLGIFREESDPVLDVIEDEGGMDRVVLDGVFDIDRIVSRFVEEVDDKD
jgi:hypothetical protein